MVGASGGSDLMMDHRPSEEEDRELLAKVAPHILRDVEAGLDDLREGRTVPGEVVLAAIDAKIDAWKAQRRLMDSDGESCSDGTTSY